MVLSEIDEYIREELDTEVDRREKKEQRYQARTA